MQGERGVDLMLGKDREKLINRFCRLICISVILYKSPAPIASSCHPLLKFPSYISSILQFNGGHPTLIITKQNFTSFIDMIQLPVYILQFYCL
jgi:hypothetical protein